MDRKVAREVASWLARDQGPSQLPDDVDAAAKVLSTQPYAGQRIGRRYRYTLRVTPFVLFYVVRPRNREVRIVELVHRHQLRAS